MPDQHYINPKLAELYDLDSPWSRDRDFYFGLAGPPPQSILDLGCGTGLLCQAFAAKGHLVCAVDPSAAMLNIGKRKINGNDIDWVESTAQNFRSNKRFDLIIMTGHAFQVLLEDRDIMETLETMRRHIKVGGQIVFESRNPAIDWQQHWDYDITIELPGKRVLESRRFLARQGDRMTFELQYKFPEESLVSKSELRFLSKTEIEGRLRAAGLAVKSIFGDWDATAFDSSKSLEMIFVVEAKG